MDVSRQPCMRGFGRAPCGSKAQGCHSPHKGSCGALHLCKKSQVQKIAGAKSSARLISHVHFNTQTFSRLQPQNPWMTQTFVAVPHAALVDFPRRHAPDGPSPTGLASVTRSACSTPSADPNLCAKKHFRSIWIAEAKHLHVSHVHPQS